MKTWFAPLVSFAVLLLVLCGIAAISIGPFTPAARGQFGGVEQPMFSQQVVTQGPQPPNAGAIMYRWVESGLPSGAVTSWVDRIQSLAMLQPNATYQPSKAAGQGVYFKTSFVSNEMVNLPASPYWLGLIVGRTNGTDAAHDDVFICKADPGDPTPANLCAYTDILYSIPNTTGTEIGRMPTGVEVCDLLMHIYGTYQMTTYTNGVLSFTNISVGTSWSFSPLAIGGYSDTSAIGRFKGAIYEVIYWTNSAPSPVDWNTYRTQVYTNSP